MGIYIYAVIVTVVAAVLLCIGIILGFYLSVFGYHMKINNADIRTVEELDKATEAYVEYRKKEIREDRLRQKIARYHRTKH